MCLLVWSCPAQQLWPGRIDKFLPEPIWLSLHGAPDRSDRLVVTIKSNSIRQLINITPSITLKQGNGRLFPFPDLRLWLVLNSSASSHKNLIKCYTLTKTKRDKFSEKITFKLFPGLLSTSCSAMSSHVDESTPPRDWA